MGGDKTREGSGLGKSRAVGRCKGFTNLLQMCLHDLRAVVDSKNDVSDTSLSKGLDLMLDHGLVAKLDERLGKGQGLKRFSFVSLVSAFSIGYCSKCPCLECARQADSCQWMWIILQEVGDGCRSHRRE